MTTPAVVSHNPTPDKSTTDFLVKDYELKIRYLSYHFTRMWNRFNYFVAIESALVGGKFLFGRGKLSQGLAVIGAVSAFVWYAMGAEDRYLVEVYRKHVEDAGALVAQALWPDKSISYHYVGEIERTSRDITQSISGWRLKSVSTTKLVALIPLLLTLTWIGLLFSKQ